MRKEAKWDNDRRRLPLAFVSFFLLLPSLAAAGQGTTSGLSLKKTCPGQAVIGDTVTCTLQVENQGASNVTGLTVTNQVPFPGGPILPVSGCATSLGASDGTANSGPDYTDCEVTEVLDQECPSLQIVVIDEARAAGTDEGTGPVSASATNAVLVSCVPEQIPDPEPVPAASTVGLFVLALGLVGFGAARIAKRG